MNSQKLYQAIKLASVAHKGQLRKGKDEVPYICHPVFVGMELLRLGYDQDVVIASILHDVFEDTSISKATIEHQFGRNVLELIEAVTEPKDHNMSREEKRRTWETRKESKLKKLESGSPEARAIACADMWVNMLEMVQTIEEEGLDAKKYFNVDLEKKLEHSQKELELFARDTNYSYLRLIPEIQNILAELQNLLPIPEKGEG